MPPAIAGISLDRPRIMGIVNVTPDSFSDGGQFASARDAIDHALRLVEEGADILDIGAESTRPGSDPVPEAEELDRLIPVIEEVARRAATPISADTRKPRVMEQAAKAGAVIWNDVSALTFDADGIATAVRLGCPVILMHAKGDPKIMQDDPSYDDVVGEVYGFLKGRVAACEAAGIARAKLIADPGIGFGKTVAHNLALIKALDRFHDLGCPLMLGASRKRFIGMIDRGTAVDRRLAGSLAAVLAGAVRGAQMFRVHDVAETRQALAVWQAIGEA